MARIFAAGLMAVALTADFSYAACCQARPPETAQEAYERERREKEQERVATIGICVGVGILALVLGAQFVRDTRLAIEAHQARDNGNG